MVVPLALLSAVAAVPTVEIAKGVRMPTINLGTCCGSKPSVGLNAWVKYGGDFIGVDTSDDYGRYGGDSQAVLASSIAKNGISRDRLFYLTKVDTSDRASTLKQVKSDLQQLNIAQADLVLLHHPRGSESARASQWQGLEDALAQNLTRAIGVSNYNSQQLEALAKTATVPPALNQCSMNVKSHDDATISYCQKHGITYEAFDAAKGCDSSSATIKKIASAHGKSAYQVCLRYIVDRGCVMAVGTGADASTVDEYAKDDLDIFDFKLSSDELSELSSL